MITAMDAQHIPAAIVTSQQHHTTAQGHLQRNQHVVAVQPEFLGAPELGGEAMGPAPCDGFIRRGTTTYDQALPFAKGETVPDQLQC